MPAVDLGFVLIHYLTVDRRIDLLYTKSYEPQL
jgi:hypothetical protein